MSEISKLLSYYRRQTDPNTQRNTQTTEQVSREASHEKSALYEPASHRKAANSLIRSHEGFIMHHARASAPAADDARDDNGERQRTRDKLMLLYKKRRGREDASSEERPPTRLRSEHNRSKSRSSELAFNATLTTAQNDHSKPNQLGSIAKTQKVHV